MLCLTPSLCVERERGRRGKNIHFRSDKLELDESFELHQINRLKEILRHVFSQLIFNPAITGSGMTSRIFGVGSILFSRSLQKNETLFRLSFVPVPTYSPSRTKRNIDGLGIK